MKCPNCGIEMKEKYSWIPCIEEDEADYYLSGYECRKCGISYDCMTYKYTLPDHLMPTDKQIRTVSFICSQLAVNEELPITKSQYCEFIGRYLEKAQQAKDEQSEYDDEWYYEYDVPINC